MIQSMHHLATSLAVGSFLYWGQVRACSFETLAAQVPVASEALRVPLPSAGLEAQEDCAAMASAYGYGAASVRTILNIVALPSFRCYRHISRSQSSSCVMLGAITT